MTTTTEQAVQFFDRYRTALLARDEAAVAQFYGVPALIVFPGQVIPVSDSAQTEAFFASSWPQYEGVETVDSEVAVLAEAPGSIWADVTWSHDGQPLERFCYQLVEMAGKLKIAVLTPLATPAPGADAP